MPNNFLRLDEDRILVEQLRLLLRNFASVLFPTLILSILLVLALSNERNVAALWVWCATLTLSKLFSTYHARRYLASNISFERARRLVWKLIILNAVGV